MTDRRAPAEREHGLGPRIPAPHGGLLALAVACGTLGWLELAFACADGDLLPRAVCNDGHLTTGTYIALVLAAFVPTVMGSARVWLRATSIVVLCVLVPFCLGYVHVGG